MSARLSTRYSALAIAISLSSTPAVFAADTSESNSQEPNAITLDKVQVWGTAVTSSSVNIDEDSMQLRQADHISDLLRTIPGVDVGGAHSLNQRITIRSMDDKDIDISIDGARQNTYMFHHMGNLQIHADILESVDIQVGKNSVINGGLGGTVKFRTKSADQLLQENAQFGGRLQAGYNSNEGHSLAATGYGQITEQVDVLAYHNHVQRGNYTVGGGKILDSNGDEVDGTDGEVLGLEGTQKDSLLKFGIDLDANQRLSVGYERYRDKGDYSQRPDMGLATDLAIGSSLGIPLEWPTEFDRDTYTINYDAQLGGTYVEATLYDNESTFKRDETGYAENPAFVDYAGRGTGIAQLRGINLLFESSLNDHTLTYGIEHTLYDTEYKYALTNGDSEGNTEDSSTISLYVQDRWNIKSTDIIIGGRYDTVELNTTLTDDSFSEFTAGLGIEQQITDSLSAGLHSTQLFKAPEVAEVYIGAGLNDTPNPDIDAETGINHELSLDYADAVLGADKFSVGATVFQTEINDYIYDYAASGLKDNVGDLTIRGSELYLGYDIANLQTMLTFSRAASDLDATSEYPQFDGARIDRQQGNTLSLNLDYSLPATGVTLHADVLDVDDLDHGLDIDGASVDKAKDGYTVVNVSARWTPAAVSGLTVTAGIDNLTDEFYASQSSRTGVSNHPRFGELYLYDYEPGRNYKLTLAYNF
jgi:hemoglobin/transferrin/lactoferrin receptor protein